MSEHDDLKHYDLHENSIIIKLPGGGVDRERNHIGVNKTIDNYLKLL